MRVLYLAPPAGDGPGAITGFTFLDEELLALRAAGVEAYVLSTATCADDVVGGVAVRALPLGSSEGERARTLPFVWRFARDFLPYGFRRARLLFHLARIERYGAELVRREGIDLVHSHFGWPGGMGGQLVRAATGRPLIASFRGMDLVVDRELKYGLRHDVLYDGAVRSLLLRADRTTFVSDFLRRQGLMLNAVPDRTVVLPKGVDLQRFAPVLNRPALRGALGIERPMILTVAGLVRLKGIHHIIKAAAALRDLHQFTLVICGEGEQRASLERMTREHGLRKRVRFLGRVSRMVIPRFFAACDVFAHASLREASGNVLLEAMASGRPVVCTDAGGPAEYVSNRETGFVVPVGDIGALCDRIGFLLANPDVADAMGQAGRRLATERFAYDRMIGQIVDLYREVAERDQSETSSALRSG